MRAISRLGERRIGIARRLGGFVVRATDMSVETRRGERVDGDSEARNLAASALVSTIMTAFDAE